ncbi:MAG TPA: aminotransferase class I/II-fold pyridoxal phosphate-dependent enzyme [Pseudonocardiaceae bacterium]|nr:aminotransferase class I/II-fold pyridoxal phosphate-dependent enzyme [Pseudonocardiaceae bacterium]
MDFAAEDVFLTRGASGAVALALQAVVEPGDEVIFLSPPWFFYEAMILASGATPARVRLQHPAFDLDIDAIVARWVHGPEPSSSTHCTIPRGESIHRPLLSTGGQAGAAAAMYGRPVWVISDEAYSRIIFDGRKFFSPAFFHPYSLLAHTYS